jgi:hypothetical protein
MLFSLINNYLICYKTDIEGELIAKNVFDFEKYLSFFEKESYSFMIELCKTQGFHTFIERSCTKDEKNETHFFRQGVKLCSTKGEKELAFMVKKIRDQLLRNNKSVYITVILDNSHYLFL